MSPSNQYWGQRRLMYLLPYFFEIQILYSLGRDIYGKQIIKNTYLAHKSMCWYHFLAIEHSTLCHSNRGMLAKIFLGLCVRHELRHKCVS